MSRVATLSLLYTSDFSKARADYTAWKDYVESNPPKVGLSAAGRGGPATTFGGGQTVTQQGSISAVAAGVAAPPVVNNFYGTSSGGAMQTAVATANQYAAGIPHVAGSSQAAFSGVGGNFVMRHPFPSGYGTMYSGGFNSAQAMGAQGSPIEYPQPSGPSPFIGPPREPQPWLPLGSYGQYSGGPIGPWASGTQFGSGGVGNGQSIFPSFSRAGIRSFLGKEGLRGIGRYIGAYGIVEAGRSAINQQNQLGIALGGARSTADVIGALTAYQDNSPLASIPFAGPLGLAFREYATGDRAYLATVQSSTAIGDENFDILNNARSTRSQLSAAAYGSRGDFAGQRAGLTLSYQNTVTSANVETAKKVTQLNSQITSLTAGRHQLPKAEADKIAGIRQQIVDVQTANSQFVAGQGPIYQNQLAANNRSEYSDIVGSEYETTAIGQEFGNTRGAAISRLTGGYESRIAATADYPEQQRIRGQENAALRNEKRQYARETGFTQFDTGTQQYRDQASIYASGHYNYSASIENISAQSRQALADYRKETAGLDASDPMQAERIKAANDKYIFAIAATTAAAAGLTTDFNNVGASLRVNAQTSLSLVGLGGFGPGALEATNNASYEKFTVMQANDREHDYGPSALAEYAQNNQGYLDRRFNAVIGISRRDSNTIGNEYRAKAQPLAGGISEIIGSGQNDILQAEYDYRGDPKLRDAEVRSIRQNTLSAINAQLTPAMKYGGRVEQVSAYVLGGDRNNQRFKDYQAALALQKGAGAALDHAEQTGKLQPVGNNPTADQISKLQAQMDQLIQAVGALQ